MLLPSVWLVVGGYPSEEALLGTLGSTGERNLRRVDVPLGHRGLRVTCSRLFVHGGVAGGGVVHERGMSEVVPRADRMRPQFPRS